MSAAGSVPFGALLASFLKAAIDHNMETFVWSAPRGVVGAKKQYCASNTAEAEAKARAALLIQDGTIDRVAEAIHRFRFVEKDQPIDPSMDLCMFGPCAATFDSTSTEAQLATTLWADLHKVVQDAHRALATALIAVALTQAPPKVEKSKLIV